MDPLLLFLRTVLIYFAIMFVMRIMGKREIGKLSLFDMVVSFMIADISAIVLEDEQVPFMQAMIPIGTLAGLQILFSLFLLKNRTLRKVVDGEPVILIKNGEIQDQEMAKTRYNLDDLMTQLREKNVWAVSDVEFAVLETTGKLSVFPREDLKESESSRLKAFHLPIPVIIEGKVQDEGLQKLEQNRFWLKRELQKRGFTDFQSVYFASVDYRGQLYVDGKDEV